ncbi:hypothetical protein KHU50_001614 [Colletotrichum sp. SAR 10_65]|nr:hypothetical protein KHU50_001614 [Colletotrichum sp. SAR 10_65]KAJ5000304.1 hypothetical protein K4K48_002863 [Colletotrichum sp. SAR 10_66]
MQFKTQFAILAALAPVLQALPVDNGGAAYGIFYANSGASKVKRDDADAAYGIFYANGADSKERDETNVSA